MQQRVVVVCGGTSPTRAHAAAEQDGGHLVARLGFVPGQDEQGPLRLESGRVEDLGDVRLQPRVAGRRGAVMHVMAHVGCDECVVRCGRRRSEVARELRVWHDMGVAPACVRPDVVEVHERIVFLGVWIAVADIARRGHAFHVALPGAAGGFEVVRDVRRGDPAGGAVAGDSVCAATHEAEIVRQAGVADVEVVRRKGARWQKAVDVRRRRAANDLVVGPVLHHDHEDVVVRRHACCVRRRCCRDRCRRRGAKGGEKGNQSASALQNAGIVTSRPRRPGGNRVNSG